MPSSREDWVFLSSAASQHGKWRQTNILTHSELNCMCSHKLSLVLLQLSTGERQQGHGEEQQDHRENMQTWGTAEREFQVEKGNIL